LSVSKPSRELASVLRLVLQRLVPLIALIFVAWAPSWAEGAGQDGKAEPAAQSAPAARLSDVEEPAAALVATIDTLEKAVERAGDDEEELARLRFDVEGLASGADLLREHFGPRLSAVQSQINKLGSAPGKDGPPESLQIAAERDRLSAVAGIISGAIRTTDLVGERARQLFDKVQDKRQTLFTDRILARSQSPLSVTTWHRFAAELPGAGRQLASSATSWLEAARGRGLELAVLVAFVMALYVVLRALVHRFLARRLDADPSLEPSFFARTAVASWVAPASVIAPAAAVLALAWGLDSIGLLIYEFGKVAPVVLSGIALVIAVHALATAILAPRRPQWRLVGLADNPARIVARTITWIGAIYSADLVASELARMLAMPLPVSVMIATASSLAMALMMLRLVRTPFTPQLAASTRAAPDAAAADGPGTERSDELAETVVVPASESEGQGPEKGARPVSRLEPLIVKLPLLVFGLIIIASVLAGYVALGRFIAGQVVVTGSAAVVVLLVHLAIRALLGAPGSGIRPLSAILAERASLSEDQGIAITRALTLLLDAVLALIALPLLLLTWGYTLPEALSWLKAAIFGFEIGQFRISFARIVLAILLFLALLFLTRLIQRWLQAGPLQSAKIDRGIANSIHTAVGYAGFALAALVAVSYGGLDITSFAIVAGALSVGIGFGLQSIINNFVSGLILLVERPIKVGDLVAVGGREGRVRSIAVRSTEIETGDKASLIVPNSELITGTVTNWTHRNALGRVVIKVGASYNADPEQVRDVLQKVASECALIMQHPPPGVSFDNFGPAGFEFSLSGVVSDVGKAGAAQTDLRLSIVRAFRAAGIEMPHPQHDIHLRDLDRLWALLQRAAAERAGARPDASDAAKTVEGSPAPARRRKKDEKE